MKPSFRVAYEKINTLCTTKGYALLTDVLQDLAVKLIKTELDAAPLGRLLDGMSNVEYRLASGTDEKIQAASLVGGLCANQTNDYRIILIGSSTKVLPCRQW
jgi:replication factor C subunit 3/5